ncbi:GNAT family N-acetyltransferase [Flavobacterium fluviatile]|uniref:GNAT family N-acetyltransferase n=1 Tax=Flavobacterium fluviatile TaxID=1862387 RepID=UPI0013D4E388|nr:GNAT family N-acetyltransferase [Flavobacterium fluviatile]
MIIKYQNIELESIKSHHIEQIRNWRNLESIQNKMIYREYITFDEQEIWFEDVVTKNKLFFICKIDHEPIGLIYSDNIDWEQKISYNSGIFLIDNTIYGTGYPILISLLFTYCGFNFNLRENIVKVLNDNDNALQFNKLIGYVLKEEHPLYSIFSLKKNDFYNTISKFPNDLKITDTVEFYFEKTEMDHFIQKILKEENIVLGSEFKIIFPD